MKGNRKATYGKKREIWIEKLRKIFRNVHDWREINRRGLSEDRNSRRYI